MGAGIIVALVTAIFIAFLLCLIAIDTNLASIDYTLTRIAKALERMDK
jgi:uncharacterized protein YoxC